MEVVYAMRDANGFIKIGFTGNLDRRVASVRTRRGVPVEAIWSAPGSPYLEFQLHREFAKYWVANEWFDFGALEPVALIAAAVERLRPPRFSSATREEVLPQLRKIKKTRSRRGSLPRGPIQLALDAGMRIGEIAKEAGCSTTAVKSVRRDMYDLVPDLSFGHLLSPKAEKESAS